MPLLVVILREHSVDSAFSLPKGRHKKKMTSRQMRGNRGLLHQVTASASRKGGVRGFDEIGPSIVALSRGASP